MVSFFTFFAFFFHYLFKFHKKVVPLHPTLDATCRRGSEGEGHFLVR